MTERREIYRSANARVIVTGQPVGKTCCVTFFTYASDESTLPLVNGFGEEILTRLALPAVHIINLKNHWWQIPDLQDCLQAAQEASSAATRRIGYGSSMGAYAVLRFSEALAIDESLCFSPQFSISRKLVPFETRWSKEARSLDFSQESMKIRQQGIHHIIYDPGCDDRQHVELIRAHNPDANLVLHEVSAGGHFVIRDYQSKGHLTRLVSGFRAGHVDPQLIVAHPDHKDHAAAPG
ncbi:hypothetical protein HOY34_20440 [Xinfangfangia sp. D13-10-4-6]|uniref:hypothetical protein n=1 Tax=Pseudogemmobacter hezensis TaxID=2737662 RepID=UPI00155813F5|nr:hypothetical protein [Pseudogemmobacter hezensis]NPD17557.1 hypothetical protein [Pseudogemmobacter hezensis]